MSHPVDVHAGRKLKQIRTLRRMSQTELGRRLNLTFQHIQKYEIGSNRLHASKIHELSRILDVPPAFFFEGFDEAGTATGNYILDFDLDDALSSIQNESDRARVRKFIKNAVGMKIQKK